MKGLMANNTSFRRTFVGLVLALILFNGIFITVSPELSVTALLKYIVYRDPLARVHTSACPKMSVQPAGFPDLLEENLACLPHIPSEKSCKYTAKAYAPYPSLLECPELPYELCTVSEKKPVSNDSFTSLKIQCDLSLCDLDKPMYIETINPANGRLTKYEIPRGANDSTIEGMVLKYAEASRRADLNFLYLNCTGLYTKVKISQLLTFLPALPRLINKTHKNKVNVNVFLIDSLSRAHFYRSLPNTVKFLRQKNADPNFPAHVFEFELFQAVHGHTHESEHALFSGTLYPEEWTSKQKTAKPVDLHVLYGLFKEAGYQTMFLDDLCWLAIYGIVTKVKATNWGTLLEKTREANWILEADNTSRACELGKVLDWAYKRITEAACKILRENAKHTLPFFDNKEHQLCFNGKHQHEYLFDYLVRYIAMNRARPRSKPFFAYTTTHVSHDEIGLRVQSVDKHLRDFIEAMSSREDTISFVFADHGNTYTSYQVKYVEGRQEMYHPTMLVILPKKLGRKFGNKIIQNLIRNQRRLFNMLDFRASLVALAKFDGKTGLDPAGMFGHISKNRTCKDLTLTGEAICICRARNHATKLNPADQFILSEFAIGQLNDKLQNAYLKTRKFVSPVLFGSCQRLRIQKISNIKQEYKPGGVLATTMDMTVQSGTVVDQKELVTVQVESTVSHNTKSSLKMKLLSFDRISKYGPHEECADPGVPLNLCVCNKKSAVSKLNSIQDIAGQDSSISSHVSSSCILQIQRVLTGGKNTPKAGIYELANICENHHVNVTITSIDNTQMSTDLPIFLSLPPRTIYFVGSWITQNTVDKLDMKLQIRSRKIF